MNGQNINIGTKPLRVLISPLDWGLGHATRIITIVKILENYDVSVLIAAEGPAAVLLKTEFPHIPILPLRGYRVQYSRNKKKFFRKLLGQFPGIISAIKRENRWLKEAVKIHQIDAVISDNRFGLYHPAIPSVYITHQLFIETGKKFMNGLAQKIHYKYINRFSECWVPDFEETVNIAGKLSHPAKLPAVPVKYLGPLSRFKKDAGVIIDNTMLILLSGPEPQRSIWEADLLQQAKNTDRRIVFVRGLPGCKEELASTATLEIHNHLPAGRLNKLVAVSEWVICRSGYSTVMDLVALDKRAILIPTPGQAEQEYLAGYLKEQQLFYSCSQQEFRLEDAVSAAEKFPRKTLATNFEAINERVIREWIISLKARALK